MRVSVLSVSLLLAGSVLAADTRALLSEYVRAFNAADEELYTNAIPNSAAEAFLASNVPRFACPDKDIERTYYFRWWTFRKHLRNDLGHWTITEFLPKVGWSGKDNTIVCPAGHHLREGRWLRDPSIVADDARFWLTDPEATHRWTYSSWLFTGVCGIAAVSGRDELPVELLDAAVAYYRRWEQGFVRSGWPTAKTAFMGGDGKGGFLSIDNCEGTEISLGGNGYKPLFTSAMWSEAASIAKVAKAAGRQDLAAEFSAKAEVVRQSLFAQCWNPACAFFTTCATNGLKGTARELHGYAPWYFGLPTEGRDPDWALLDVPQGFAAKFGLTFVERRAPGFALEYTGHECKWNGPSWPFATAIALTALANDLHARPVSQTSRTLFTSLLHQYAAQQSRVRPDGSTVPWIDENLNPDTGEWMARKMLLARGFKPVERGKDYNHSTFCDLVIGGLIGIVPAEDGGFTVDPLCPREWDFFRLDNLCFRGHEIEVVWRKGDGLSVTVDGCVAARRSDLGRLVVPMAERPVRAAEPMRLVLTFDDGTKDHLLIAAPELEKRGWRGVFNIITDKIGSAERYMSWEDVRELLRRGHEVTTHTASHPSLVKLLQAGNTNEVRRQLSASRDLIAAQTGFAPRYMCAPYMGQNADTDRLCREAGLRQMNVGRHNFGTGDQDSVAEVLADEAAKGRRRLDLLHHGVTKGPYGGWSPFDDRVSFARHLDRIAELERQGVVRVTDYDGCASDCALKAPAWPHHGVLALSFDDRHLSAWETAFPLFARHQATATFCITGAIDTNAVVFARKALANGHEIALHGLKHCDADADVAKIGTEAYWEREMKPQVDACRAAGIPVFSFAYPNCRHDATTDGLFWERGFTRLRGSIPGVKSPNPHDPKGVRLDQWRPVAEADPFFAPALGHLTERSIPNVILGESYHTDIDDILRAVARAGERAERLSLVSHGIGPGAKGINMKTEWLERILSAAARSGVVVHGLR